MLIFATSDIHGDFNSYKKVVNYVNFKDSIDAVLFLGDITGKYFATSLEELREQQEKDYAFFKLTVLNKINKKVLYILGNVDWIEETEGDSRCLKNEASNIIPFEYVNITSFNTNREADEEILMSKLSKLNITEDKIIAAHVPPYKVVDRCLSGVHAGSIAVKKTIEEKQPKIYFCGHIHEAYGDAWIDNTLVLNCACYNINETTRGWLVNTESREYYSVQL